MRIVITGGAGFIGCNFIKYELSHYDDDIICIDSLTYAGSLDNLKDGVTGRHFISGDADDLAAKLVWALDIPAAEQQKITQAARNFVKENFTKQIMCDKTLTVYRNLVNTNKN